MLNEKISLSVPSVYFMYLNLKVEPAEASFDSIELFAINNKTSINYSSFKKRITTTNNICCLSTLVLCA